ncbi:aldo/keto reductase [Streptomyces sp. PSKA30]|uniref:aldo/keto reductase n=1 Tax=Streptomyces sp. PSKA30 TaxID=2874597 RepID=UPI001CD11AE0|nr:aldo/keto reductase [Streptomyces sp. PSKA30]MBZ9641405.1 aldo/keto reductase [Streptomyces sp. PSKA30]
MNSPAAPTLTLNNRVVMPRLGLGTWPLEDRDAEHAVVTALHHGYRLIDTASSYGNEHAVGRGIRASGLRRKDVFVTTKLHGEDHGYDSALRAFETSLTELNLDYLDLYLIHWPVPSKGLFVDTWRALQKLMAEGLVRAIGVSNFKPAHIERLIDETGITPAVNQVQLHPQTTQRELRAYHRTKGIVTESWSPLGQGSDLLDAPEIHEIAAKRRKSPGQIVLRWHMELGLIAIPKSGNSSRIAANIDIFDFTLTAGEVDALSALDTGAKPPVDSDVTQPGLRRDA